MSLIEHSPSDPITPVERLPGCKRRLPLISLIIYSILPRENSLTRHSISPGPSHNINPCLFAPLVPVVLFVATHVVLSLRSSFDDRAVCVREPSICP